MKKFHLSDILSITTYKLVSNRHMEGVYDILNYMTDSSIYTHEIPRAMEICKPKLLQQFPQLKNETFKDLTKHEIEQWLSDKINKYGEWLEVEKI